MTNALDELRVGILVRICCVQAIDIRQQQEAVGTRHLRYACSQPVVISISNLGRGHRVILIDDRHGAELQQRRQRGAGIEITPADFAVLEREQHLRDRDTLFFQQLFVRMRQADLAHSGGGLLSLRAAAGPWPV